MACRAEARSEADRPASASLPPSRFALWRGILRVARRAEAHASALARVSEGWWAARGSNPGHPD